MIMMDEKGGKEMLYKDEIMPMLTVKDVARLLHIHVNTARRWSDQGILKSYRITRRGDRRFKQEDIARFLAEYNEFNMKFSGKGNVAGEPIK
jgi:excisionase family DNA binding protein